jgi:type I restriction enzyme S subunit
MQRKKLNKAYWLQEGPGVRKWQFTDKGIKLLNVANILKSGIIDLSKTARHLSIDEVESRYSHFLADEGDLVIASSGISIDVDGFLRTRGAFIEKEHLPLCMNTSTIRFKAMDETSDLGFLRHWLQSFDFRIQITREVTGIAQKNFGPSHLSRIEIPLPPLSEQKRIAVILDAADRLRAKRREALAQLDTLLQSTFLDLFGDPVTNPKGWEVVKLPDIVAEEKHSLKRGPFGGALKKEIFVPKGFKVYEQKHVIYDDFETGKYFIDTHDYARLDAFKVKPNDLLVSCSGTIGRIAIVPENASAGVMNQALLKIRLEETKMLNLFFLGLWRSPPFERHVLGMTHGTGMKNMKSMKELKNINFITPPIPLQQRFAALVGQVESQ